MKNIVYIGKYNGIVGGIERYMQKSASLLRRSDYRVHYLYTENGGRDQAQFAGAFDTAAEFSLSNRLLASADLVMIHNIISPELLKGLPQGRTFFFAHDHNIYCRRHHYYTPLGRKNCHRAYHALRCFFCSLGRNNAPPLAEYRKLPAIVLSDFMRDNLLKNGFEKVIKLPAFIQTEYGERSFMPEGVLRILFLGQLIRGKGADLMIRSLAKLSVPFECTVAGDGNDRAMLEKMLAEYKLQDKVRFCGFVSKPEELWKNCDVFCFPIRWQEPFGLVGLEAMAHGVPVVAFDRGGVREYLEDNRNGLAVPEHGDLENALAFLAENPGNVLEKMSKYGRKMAEEKFSEGCFLEKFAALLPEVLQ
ncbi:MAG: glycosyltransferase family 4 protein [Lentisphaeria bacterium]|nr:glycosyltransferase family 4 protein [Lentisphaeria bacterium]